MASESLKLHANRRPTRRQVQFRSQPEPNDLGLGNADPTANVRNPQGGSSSQRRKRQRYRQRRHGSSGMYGSQIQVIENDASCQEQFEEQLQEAEPCAGQLCKLCSAEGDIFEVEASLLCRHSTLACDLIEDQDDEEIPLPEVGTGTLRLLVEFCKSNRHPGILRSQANLPCDLPLGMSCELLWAAKLLNMKQLQGSVTKVVSQQLELGNHGEPPFHSIPIGLLHSIVLHGVKCLSQESLCNLISSAAERATSGHEQSAVAAIIPCLDHKCHQVVNAAVASLRRIGTEPAQLALFTHPKYIIRLQALPILSSATCGILAVVFQELQNPCWLHRVTAVHALGKISHKGDIKATKELVQKLKDSVREVRDAAVSALQATVTPDDPSTINAIMDLVLVAEWPVQCAALRALSFAAPGNPKLVESLAQQLAEGSATVVKHTANRILRDMRLLNRKQLAPCLHEVETEEEQISPSNAASGLRRPRGPAWCDAGSDDDEWSWPMST